MWCCLIGMFPVALDVELGTVIGLKLGLPWWLSGEESACNVGDLGSTPGLGKSPGVGNANPLQYFGLENSMDIRAWWATVHAVAKHQT